MPKGVLLFFFGISLFGCTFKSTTYSDEGESSYIWFDKDSTKGAGFSIVVDEGLLTITAKTYVMIEPGELDYYKFIDFNFAGLKQDTVRMHVSLTDTEKNSEIFHLATSDWESVNHQLKAIENTKHTSPLTLECERQYTLSSLPAKLQLHYKIATKDTLIAGSAFFKAVVTETKGTMRWH